MDQEEQGIIVLSLVGFDNLCFLDWFQTTALPFCRRKSGRCVLFGGNPSSPFSDEVFKMYEEHNMTLCCLPPNSRHMCQPLDVAFFRPTKKK